MLSFPRPVLTVNDYVNTRWPESILKLAIGTRTFIENRSRYAHNVL
jgi:hypothetical protein